MSDKEKDNLFKLNLGGIKVSVEFDEFLSKFKKKNEDEQKNKEKEDK